MSSGDVPEDRKNPFRAEAIALRIRVRAKED
jgi:hypothetical protein